MSNTGVDSSESTSLPPDTPNQTYLSVKPIVAGTIQLPLRLALHEYRDQPDDVATPAPALAFLLTHPERGHVLFDLGIRKNCEGYPPILHSRIHGVFHGVCEEDVADQLRKGTVQPEDIRTIILSHVHWDHTGDPSLFPNAEIVLGAGTQPLLNERVYPDNPEGRMNAFPKGNKLTFVGFQRSASQLDSESSSAARFKPVSPFATFEHAVDFFGDGSLYLIDAPGHIPGHMSALARAAPGVSIFLGGDLCHHREAYEPGIKLTSETMYEDLKTADGSIHTHLPSLETVVISKGDMTRDVVVPDPMASNKETTKYTGLRFLDSALKVLEKRGFVVPHIILSGCSVLAPACQVIKDTTRFKFEVFDEHVVATRVRGSGELKRERLES